MLKEWYNKDGLIQFLLGNKLSDPDMRLTGVVETMVFCWTIILFFFVIPFCLGFLNENISI